MSKEIIHFKRNTSIIIVWKPISARIKTTTFYLKILTCSATILNLYLSVCVCVCVCCETKIVKKQSQNSEFIPHNFICHNFFLRIALKQSLIREI